MWSTEDGIRCGINYSKTFTIYGGLTFDEDIGSITVDINKPCGIGEAVSTSFLKFAGKQCEGSNPDLLREYAATAPQCLQKCQDLGVACDGFIRVNSGNSNGFNGECFFRDGIQDPITYTADNRDCFVWKKFDVYYGMNCDGSATDWKRDFVGTQNECANECASNGQQCAGFIRVITGTHAGKCFFRGGTLQDPEINPNTDLRHCYKKQASWS